ncbi:ATP-binding protein [Pseudenhygromyxa sp. WMMC2535]|uniref:ATP-binding protein n=1 Tax=Pseudenhygromyxa sp. WMMC2535 TaxID=2712867 RepID=UPI001556FBB7|nr:ATP-binding protein [Pseudenhygromyxa sp. WMMC2535]NVB40737.1 ATP-binding protein [Pseudenhygromyxa sp. WMMC2535]
MSEAPRQVSAGDFVSSAVDNLVTQFSSALDFYRELVQNSIDAGSAAVDIWLDFVPSEEEGAAGVIEIHVDDGGEGMNEAIIDEQLTTLFSSSKEDDLTKIGKFGIGFVSVFALGPRAVLVQTGRDGEYWEVLFDHDRSFFKSRIDGPVEGTQITLFLEGDRARYSELVTASLETIDHWCRHSEVEITFEDRASVDGALVQVNKPFTVEGECLSQDVDEGAEIVLAYSRAPMWGFYNRGLALAVVSGDTDLVPAALRHVAFRVKSRYLEHTLSRETVMRDHNYDRVMDRVRAAAEGPLRAALGEAIVALVHAGSGGRRWALAERQRYFELMGFLASEGREAVAAMREQPILVSLDGRALSLAELCARAEDDERVFVDDQSSPLSEALAAQGTPVILVPGREALAKLSTAMTFDPVARVIVDGLAGGLARLQAAVRGKKEASRHRAAQLLARPAAVLVRVEPLAQEHPLVALTQEVVRAGLGGGSSVLSRAFDALRGREQRSSYRKLVGARLHGAAGDRQPLFVVAHEIAPLMAPPARVLGPTIFRGETEAAINCEHPHFYALAQLHRREPALAAYCLAKCLLLHADRELELDTALMQAARALEA